MALKKLVLTAILILSWFAVAKEGMYDVVPKDPQLLERWNASVAFYGFQRTWSAETTTYGSGVVLAIEPADKNGMRQVDFVTAWHVVNPKLSVPFNEQIVLSNTTALKGKFSSSDVMARGIRLIAKDTHLDLAIVTAKVSESDVARLDIAPYGCNFSEKSAVHSIGFPMTSNFSAVAARKVPNSERWTKRISEGRIFGFSEVDDKMVFDVDGTEGSSGGGIFDDRNELMSVVTDGGDGDERSRRFSKAFFNEFVGNYKGVSAGPECNNFVDFIRKHLPPSALAYSEYHPTLPEFQPEYEGTATAGSRKAGALR